MKIIVDPKGEEYDSVIGLSIAYSKPFTRKSVLEYLTRKGRLEFPITVVMPCKNTITFKDLENMPNVDVPCKCGEPGRYFLKYDMERKGG